MSRLLHDGHEGDSRRIPSAASSHIPRHEKVHTQCCNTEVPLFPYSPFHDAYVATECMGARNLASDVGPIQPLPDDGAHSEASPHTSTRNCWLVSSPAKRSRLQSANTTSPMYKLYQPKQALGSLSVQSEPAIFAAQPINAVAGSINVLEQVDCSDVWRLNKS